MPERRLTALYSSRWIARSGEKDHLSARFYISVYLDAWPVYGPVFTTKGRSRAPAERSLGARVWKRGREATSNKLAALLSGP